MAEPRRRRCVRLKKIRGEVTDTALKHYETGRMEAFWDAVNALDLLLDVNEKLCGEK